MLMSFDLSPVPDVDAPLSMMMRSASLLIDIMECFWFVTVRSFKFAFDDDGDFLNELFDGFIFFGDFSANGEIAGWTSYEDENVVDIPSPTPTAGSNTSSTAYESSAPDSSPYYVQPAISPLAEKSPKKMNPSKSSFKKSPSSSNANLKLLTVTNQKHSIMSMSNDADRIIIDSGASTSGTGLKSKLVNIKPTSCSVTAAFGESLQSTETGLLPPLMLETIIIDQMKATTLLSVSQDCAQGLIGVFKTKDCKFFYAKDVMPHLQALSNNAILVITGKVEDGLYLMDSKRVPKARLLVTSCKELSIYDHVHRVLGHPGEEGMAWHRQHTIGANYSNLDASTPRPICAACAQGTMRQTSTDHLRIHRPPSPCYGSQFTLDAYTHTHRSQAGHKYCDIVTDLSTRRSYHCFTKDRGAAELCKSFSTLFQSHPEWKTSLRGIDRFIRADAEKSYRSAEFLQCLYNFGYRLEPTPPCDKHANGIAERAVGVLSMKCNITMQPLGTRVPQKYWDLACEYTCVTHAFNYHSAIKTSPYHLITEKHVILKNLKAFWSLCWVHIALEDRKGKIGFPRAYKARFFGYDLSRTLELSFKVIEILPTGIYGKIRTSKDVIFDKDTNYNNTDEYPSNLDFTSLHQNINDDISAVPPATAVVQIDSEQHIATLAIAIHPIPLAFCTHQNQLKEKPIPNTVNNNITNSKVTDNKKRHINVKSTKEKQVSFDLKPVSIIPNTESDVNENNIGINTPIRNIENDDAIYWYSTQVKNQEQFLSLIEASHHDKLFINFKIINIPKTFWKAMAIPEWKNAIDTEFKKFEKNHCLEIVPYTEQHLVPMM